MELKGLTQHLNKINIPRAGDRIYKDECVYSFDTPVRIPSRLLFTDTPPGKTYKQYYNWQMFFLFARIHPPVFMSVWRLSWAWARITWSDITLRVAIPCTFTLNALGKRFFEKKIDHLLLEIWRSRTIIFIMCLNMHKIFVGLLRITRSSVSLQYNM